MTTKDKPSAGLVIEDSASPGAWVDDHAINWDPCDLAAATVAADASAEMTLALTDGETISLYVEVSEGHSMAVECVKTEDVPGGRRYSLVIKQGGRDGGGAQGEGPAQAGPGAVHCAGRGSGGGVDG